MGKNDSNRYENNKRFEEGDKKKERRIKSPISTGSKRSKERDALRKAVNIFSTKSNHNEGFDDDGDDDDYLFDELED